MTPSPVTPNDIKNTISNPTSDFCGNFVNTLLKLPLLIYNFFLWMLNSTGGLSQAFLRNIYKPGTIRMSFATNDEDENWMLCNGREISKASYPDLYSAIGDVYGTTPYPAPSSSSNFRIPPGGLFLLPAGALPTSGNGVTLGSRGGEEKHVLTTNEAKLQKHSHIDGTPCQAGRPNADWFGVVTDGATKTAWEVIQSQVPADKLKTSETGSDLTTDPNDAHNNTPAYMGVNCYIKT